MYKDKAKQREAVKKATQRYRANKGDSALSSSKDGLENARGLAVVDEVGDTQPVIPLNVIPEGAADVIISDADNPKRGKDIKCFADLPPDVQGTIERVSRINNSEAEYKDEKAKRTARAVHYQHLFPDRYYDRSPVTDEKAAVTGKPGDEDYNGVCTDAWRAERGR